jgi:hypothetical protein
MPLLKKIPKKMDVTPDAQFVIRPSIGPTYEVIYLYLSGGLTADKVKNLKVEVRGKAIWSLRTLERMQEINAHYRRPLSDRADVVALWFYRPELDDVDQRMTFALGTSDVDTLAITMDIDGTAPAESDIEIVARTSGARPFGVCTKIKEFPQTFAQAGEFDIADLPTRSAALAGMHLKSDKITDIKLEIDSRVALESPVLRIHDNQDEWVDSQVGYSHVNFIARGSMYDALHTEGVQDFRLKVELSEAASFDIVTEYFDTYDGL